MHLTPNNTLQSTDCEPKADTQLASKLNALNMFPITQTSIFMNKDIHIVRLSHEMAEFSTVYFALTEEAPTILPTERDRVYGL